MPAKGWPALEISLFPLCVLKIVRLPREQALYWLALEISYVCFCVGLVGFVRLAGLISFVYIEVM